MSEKIREWFRALLRFLFPEDILVQIRQAAEDAGGGTSAVNGAGRAGGGSQEGALREPTEEEKKRMRESPTERRHIVFSGRVQGVGFRYHAMIDARNQGLTGWVSNRMDGDVEMEIQGPGRVIDYVIQNLENGRWIRIDGMETEIIPVVKDERGFQVRGY